MSFLVIRELFYCLNMLLPFLKLSSVVIKSYFINHILQIHTLFWMSNIKSPSQFTPRNLRGLSPSLYYSSKCGNCVASKSKKIKTK